MSVWGWSLASLFGGDTAQPAVTPVGAAGHQVSPGQCHQTTAPLDGGSTVALTIFMEHSTWQGALPFGGFLGWGDKSTGQASTGAGVASGDRGTTQGQGHAAVAVCSGRSERPPPTLAAGGAFGRGSGLEGVLGRGPHHGLSDIIGGDPREPAVTHPCWHRRVTALTGWPPTH